VVKEEGEGGREKEEGEGGVGQETQCLIHTVSTTLECLTCHPILTTNHSPLTTDHTRTTPSYISALGLDVGSKRIGVAGCDRTGLIATGITTIERTRFERDVEQIKQLIDEREVTVLVIGLPYSMDGSLGFQAKQTKKFAKRIAKILQLPVEYTDERLTSYQAEQLIIAENRSPSRNKGLIDRKAAAIILQQWLDERRISLRVIF
jgi:putative Holliday junction resolvase